LKLLWAIAKSQGEVYANFLYNFYLFKRKENRKGWQNKSSCGSGNLNKVSSYLIHEHFILIPRWFSIIVSLEANIYHHLVFASIIILMHLLSNTILLTYNTKYLMCLSIFLSTEWPDSSLTSHVPHEITTRHKNFHPPSLVFFLIIQCLEQIRTHMRRYYANSIICDSTKSGVMFES
jgi:hypothetical protein